MLCHVTTIKCSYSIVYQSNKSELTIVNLNTHTVLGHDLSNPCSYPIHVSALKNKTDLEQYFWPLNGVVNAKRVISSQTMDFFFWGGGGVKKYVKIIYIVILIYYADVSSFKIETCWFMWNKRWYFKKGYRNFTCNKREASSFRLSLHVTQNFLSIN